MIRIFLKQGLFGYKTYRIFTIIASVLFFLNGISNIFWGSQHQQLSLIIGLIMLLVGIGGLYNGIFMLAPKNAPRIELSEKSILLKESRLSKEITFLWSELNKVIFQPYTISFLLADGTYHDLKIETENPEISRKIKTFIRGLTESYQIGVENR